ncbi:MAG TPA: ATP-binding protein [Chroococcidiopsis sp.]
MAKPSDRLSLTSETPLTFTQARSGRYLSFYWQNAEVYGVLPSAVVGQLLDEHPEHGFTPVAIAPYLSRIQHVIDHGIADRFNYPFRCADQYLVLELTVSPVLLPQGAAKTVLVTGAPLYACTRAEATDLVNTLVSPPSPADSGHYQKSLTQVTQNIRRTLDLETIWRQTVAGLAESLGVSRCLICGYRDGDTALTVVAERHQPGLESMLGQELSIDEERYLSQALETRRPITFTVTQSEAEPLPYSVLSVATCYQDRPNGLIILHQFDRSRVWNETEIELIRELADQVGTGIAHARLLADSQNLATELQQANENLIQQHKDLEEARQQAEEASRLKSEFLANTSHELRTPLNGMIGFLKLVMDGMADDPAEQAEFIQEAYRSAVHLLSIINDILDIAKIEAGKMQLDLNPVKLDDLLSDVDNFTRTQAEQKKLNFAILTPATRDEVVLYGNYQRLLQVLLNLVGNAIKFTHEGGITISAEVLPKKANSQDSDRTGCVKISVADTGIGVSLDKQDKLFQSFSQVDGSRTRQYGGTGLGLAISQKLVEAMNGIVNFYSMGEGLGSTVTFTVPLYQDPVMIANLVEDESELTV